MSVSYFNTNEYELMNKDNIVATVSCTRDEFNDLYFEIHHIFSQLPIGFKTFKAVSYTHLDVYKRQINSCSMNFW